jgi:hypothetical protein
MTTTFITTLATTAGAEPPPVPKTGVCPGVD